MMMMMVIMLMIMIDDGKTLVIDDGKTLVMAGRHAMRLCQQPLANMRRSMPAEVWNGRGVGVCVCVCVRARRLAYHAAPRPGWCAVPRGSAT